MKTKKAKSQIKRYLGKDATQEERPTNKPEKIIPIDNGKMIKIRRVKYTEEQTELVFHSLAHIISLRDAQWKLKGTEFYSASLERELDKISSTKLMPIFKQNDNNYISETALTLAKQFSDFCQISYQMSLQPAATQEIFNTKYKDLLINCGINVKQEI